MNYIKYWFPVFIYSGIIFYISSMESVPTPDIVHFDKVLHVCEYVPFGFLTARAIYYSKSTFSINKIILLTALAALFYGVSDEFHQSFVDGRHASVLDVCADVIGGIFGGYLFPILFLRNRKFD